MISEQHQSYVSTSQYVGNVCDLLKIRQLMLIRTHELLVKALFLYRASSDCTRLICLGSGQHPPPCYSSSTGLLIQVMLEMGDWNFTEDHRYSSLLDFNFKTLEGSRKKKPKIFFLLLRGEVVFTFIQLMSHIEQSWFRWSMCEELTSSRVELANITNRIWAHTP